MSHTPEPVAWMHNARRRDVISTDVKELVHNAYLKYGVHSNIERAPVDKSENYTIPLYEKSTLDTYRDLCAELIRSARAKLEASNLNEHVKSNFELEIAIIKAESILGEKQ